MNWTEKIKRAFNHRVLLCDLDGTLIVTKSGKTLPEDEEDWEFKTGIQYAIQKYAPDYIFIISNQGGIEKGFVDERKFMAKFRKIMEEMRTWGDFIVDGTYCASNDKDNDYRKPNTGMVDYFRHDFIDGYDFDTREALMIGDASGQDGQFSDSDLQCAKNAGIRYCDVDDFINAADPCHLCSARLACHYEGYDWIRPCGTSYRKRMKYVIVR